MTTILVNHTEGQVGAVVWGGTHFVTSPNMDVIYYPPRNAQMTFKQNMRYGDDNPLQWPQPFLSDQPHLACISREPDQPHGNIWDLLHHTQVVLLSAMTPADVLEVTKKFMRDPIRILVKRDKLTLEGIKQFYIAVKHAEVEAWRPLRSLRDR